MYAKENHLCCEPCGLLPADPICVVPCLGRRTHQCFAVKGGVDGFLDIARHNFCRVTEQVHDLANRYRSENNLPDMRVGSHANISHAYNPRKAVPQSLCKGLAEQLQSKLKWPKG
jgi:hypothetical protein